MLQITYNNCMYWMFENTAAMPHTTRNDITRYSCNNQNVQYSGEYFILCNQSYLCESHLGPAYIGVS